MNNAKNDFLEGCISGFNDACKDDDDWINLTKSEKKKAAERALNDFDKIFYGFTCVINAGIDSALDNNKS